MAPMYRSFSSGTFCWAEISSGARGSTTLPTPCRTAASNRRTQRVACISAGQLISPASFNRRHTRIEEERGHFVWRFLTHSRSFRCRRSIDREAGIQSSSG
ncbi:hypothetical protein CEXT_81251 [Caerostris extrusa]|uniref:Uncharacterized protein n=1 Tax=Caerostris extrusa TaxID=172846 RepID=A0AAV4VNL3_CAEEX|nr:hypothetical protein CEXT_81251 [Caerostris extrusa]